METVYRIKLVTSSRVSDLTKALDIYIRSVDKDADTPTNQIRDYIQNKYKDSRKMFFYILYVNNDVTGFAEYAYLPNSEMLMVDYLCTRPRNHTFFYVFYHMIYDEIVSLLEKSNYYVKYIVTELSLKKDSDLKYVDTDSNYFRHLLSVENFITLKVPYYQPIFTQEGKLAVSDYNIVIKPFINGLQAGTTIDKDFYILLLSDIYINHYASWYKKYLDPEYVQDFFSLLLERINNNFPIGVTYDDISTVNCMLFQQGLCNQISIENITIKSQRKERFTKLLPVLLCVVFSLTTFIFCYSEYKDSPVGLICSMLTIVSSVIALGEFVCNSFLKK